MRFQDIPPFTRSSSYRVNVGWLHLESTIASYAADSAQSGIPFEMDPDFQRAHVWDREKQSRYVEFVLRGGKSSRDILWNCPGWQRTLGLKGRFVLVDGKQRLEAVRAFLRGDVPAFGRLFGEFTDKLNPFGPDFMFHVNDLDTDAEVLQWYLDVNSGGVAHTAEEIAMVRGLLEAAKVRESSRP